MNNSLHRGLSPGTASTALVPFNIPSSLNSFVSANYSREVRNNRPRFSINDKFIQAQNDLFSIKDFHWPIVNPTQSKFAYLNGGHIFVWDVNTLKFRFSFPIRDIPENCHTGAANKEVRKGVEDIIWVDEFHIAVALGNGIVQLYDGEGKLVVAEKIGGFVAALAVSPDLKHFATTQFPGNENLTSLCGSTIFDCRSLIELHVFRPIRHIYVNQLFGLGYILKFHSDNESLIAVSANLKKNKRYRSRVEIFNICSGKVRTLIEDEIPNVTIAVSNFSQNGRYLIYINNKIFVYDGSHNVIHSFQFDGLSCTPYLSISSDGSEIFVKRHNGVGVYRATLDTDTLLRSDMASIGYFDFSPLQFGRGLGIIKHGCIEPVILDTYRVAVTDHATPILQPLCCLNVSPQGDLFVGDKNGRLRHFDEMLQLKKSIRTACGNICSIRCHPFESEVAVVTNGGAVMTYQTQRDEKADQLPIYRSKSSGMFVENGSGISFGVYTPGSPNSNFWFSSRDFVWVDSNRVFEHGFNYKIIVELYNEFVNTFQNLDEISTDEKIEAMVCMQGHIFCLFQSRLIAIDPYGYQSVINEEGEKRFFEDGKSVVVVLSNLKKAQHMCCVTENRIAIVMEDEISLVEISSVLVVKDLKKAAIKNANLIRHDSVHHRLIIRRDMNFCIFNEELEHLADLYILSNDRHCIHVTPQSRYFQGCPEDHPGYLWGKGDCDELFVVSDADGNEVQAAEKKKIIQSYYNRSAVHNALLNQTKTLNSFLHQDIYSPLKNNIKGLLEGACL
jgi:hypothetical protein